MLFFKLMRHGIAFVTFFVAGIGGLVGTASAQSAILASFYGRGVHAYNQGDYPRAYELLSMAIDNGIRDPRAYYFRGLVAHSTGRIYEAEADFKVGGELESRLASGPEIGRALARVQGPARLELERYREEARLQALALGNARSEARYGELGIAPGETAPPPPTNRQMAPKRPAPIKPPPAPMDDNPFADDIDQPNVQSDDAFKDAMKDPMKKPASDQPAAPAKADPFGGGNDAADPFGAPAVGDDPFGGNDPFGN